MNRFLHLFRRRTPPPPGEIYADDRRELFPTVVAASERITLWSADRPPPPSGSFLLLAVATWSGYDMRLLDALEATPDGPDVIGVLDIDTFHSQADFERRFPGIGEVVNSPVVGLWRDGQLVETGLGCFGHDLGLMAAGLDPNDRTVLDPFFDHPELCLAPTRAAPTPSGR